MGSAREYERCPQCGRDNNDWLSYCLEDGATLVSGVPDEPATVILGPYGVPPSGRISGDDETLVEIVMMAK